MSSDAHAPAPALSFLEAVLEVVADIPPGRVMTYGDVAAVLGSRGARVVGQAMARYGDGVPWWRVIRAGGLPPTCHEGRALEYYRQEGTPLLAVRGNGRSGRRVPLSAEDAARTGAEHAYRVDLARARWSPLAP